MLLLVASVVLESRMWFRDNSFFVRDAPVRPFSATFINVTNDVYSVETCFLYRSKSSYNAARAVAYNDVAGMERDFLRFVM